MFLGEYRHSIDDKGRLTVPARFRQLLEEGGYITEGFDGELMVMQKDEYERIGKSIQELSLTNQKMRELSRSWFSKGERVQPDGSGRILLPQFLRDRHNLQSEVVLVGVGGRFEIWAPDVWDASSASLDEAKKDPNYFAEVDLSGKPNE